ncbi:hypothetical protein FOA43_003201 [Brettanomyces nanus]|uniref:Uncharacterized protein n=1 Tax=Eeniella nana TaxID=13502 RepID=A0A875S813_EENNA|nr:uncharacterized protein FOA43_003201 [Brettanomyces nanus]QPG75839.1 hypothetical protein FOA43_003201 [Brettanomyces nanus]
MGYSTLHTLRYMLRYRLLYSTLHATLQATGYMLLYATGYATYSTLHALRCIFWGRDNDRLESSRERADLEMEEKKSDGERGNSSGLKPVRGRKVIGGWEKEVGTRVN